MEKLLDKRKVNAQDRKGRWRDTWQYRVRWLEFGPEHDSWEDAENILNRGLIEKFPVILASATPASAQPAFASGCHTPKSPR